MLTLTVEASKADLDDLLDRAQAGDKVVITRDGTAVAELAAPASVVRPAFGTAEWRAAVGRITRMMERGVPLGTRRFERDEMHER
jgi:antitoxin (DNA-binding transcriptional repressor) of toxin-antitoxin stability system